MVTAFLFAIRTYRLLLFIKFNTKIFSFSTNVFHSWKVADFHIKT